MRIDREGSLYRQTGRRDAAPRKRRWRSQGRTRNTVSSSSRSPTSTHPIRVTETRERKKRDVHMRVSAGKSHGPNKEDGAGELDGDRNQDAADEENRDRDGSEKRREHFRIEGREGSRGEDTSTRDPDDPEQGSESRVRHRRAVGDVGRWEGALLLAGTRWSDVTPAATGGWIAKQRRRRRWGSGGSGRRGEGDRRGRFGHLGARAFRRGGTGEEDGVARGSRVDSWSPRGGAGRRLRCCCACRLRRASRTDTLSGVRSKR